MYNGFTVIEDAAQVQLVHHLSERKWARRKQYKPEQRFNITTITKPSRTVLRMGDKLIMHPALAAELREAIKKAPPSDLPKSTGANFMPEYGIAIKPNRSLINMRGFF